MQKSGGGGGSAPTGCFKCGRPGHWSRDCPSSTTANPNPNSSSFSSKFPQGAKKPFLEKDKDINTTNTTTTTTTTTTKKAPRTRPKLTPELLLSDDGLGYVLRHFPRSFKYHGRGHEVNDLGNLIGLYAEWHSRLIPYYSFNQFVLKVEQVGATKRVRRCLGELRERIANGGDPTKLHEPPTEQVAPDCEPEAMDTGIPAPDIVDPPLVSHDADNVQEEMFDESYQKATEDPSSSLQQEPCQPSQSIAASEVNPEHMSMQNQVITNNSATDTSKIQISDEQRARMEANRLKALERVAGRARSLQTA